MSIESSWRFWRAPFSYPAVSQQNIQGHEIHSLHYHQLLPIQVSPTHRHIQQINLTSDNPCTTPMSHVDLIDWQSKLRRLSSHSLFLHPIHRCELRLYLLDIFSPIMLSSRVCSYSDSGEETETRRIEVLFSSRPSPNTNFGVIAVLVLLQFSFATTN